MPLSPVILLNPCAGRGRAGRLASRLKIVFPDARVFTTRGAGEAEKLARQHARDGAVLLAAGGDGTLGEVLNGAQGSGSTLGILPLGTGNDFARTLGLCDFECAVKAIYAGKTRRVDVGKIQSARGSRLFLNVCGAGFDALVAARINAARSHPVLRCLSGTPAYLQAVGTQLWNLQSAPLEVSVDGQTHPLRAVLVAIANAQSYGGGMRVAPDARLDDGLLDVVVVGDVSRLEWVRAFPGVFAGKHLHHPKVRVFRGRRIEVRGQLPVLCDGELWGQLPASWEVMPEPVRVLG